MTADGGVVAFSVCAGGNSTPYCRISIWTAATGSAELRDGHIAGLSGDGDVVLLATADQGALLTAPAGSTSSVGIEPAFANSLTADGSWVAGAEPVPDGGFHVARWAQDSGVERFGYVELGRRAQITDASADAAVLVGFIDDAPFRATSAGLVGLGAYPPGASGASADAVSIDGEIIAGTLAGIGGIFRWTAATGMTEIVSGVTTTPVALSDDGSVVAGSHDEPGALQSMAVRWSEASGVIALTPGIESRMSFMSASGSVIAGTLGAQGMEGVFVWNESEGARPLEDALASQGADLQGWELGPPHALSADGSVLVGEGRCGGVLAPYRAVLAN